MIKGNLELYYSDGALLAPLAETVAIIQSGSSADMSGPMATRL